MHRFPPVVIAAGQNELAKAPRPISGDISMEMETEVRRIERDVPGARLPAGGRYRRALGVRRRRNKVGVD